MTVTERLFPPKGRAVKTYKLVVEIEVSALDMVEAGMFVGKALQGADDLNIIEFEEVK
jgi:hypothetical protein